MQTPSRSHAASTTCGTCCFFAMGSNMPRRPSFIQCRHQLGWPPPDRRSYLASVGAQPGVQAGEWAAHADASHKAAWSHSFESLQLAKAPKRCRGKFAGNAQGKFGPPTDYYRCDGIRSYGDRHASQPLHCGFEAREFERCAQRKAVLGVSVQENRTPCDTIASC